MRGGDQRLAPFLFFERALNEYFLPLVNPTGCLLLPKIPEPVTVSGFQVRHVLLEPTRNWTAYLPPVFVLEWPSAR